MPYKDHTYQNIFQNRNVLQKVICACVYAHMSKMRKKILPYAQKSSVQKE